MNKLDLRTSINNKLACFKNGGIHKFQNPSGPITYKGYTYDSSIKGWRDKSNRVVGGGIKLPKHRVHLNTDGTITNLDSPALTDIRRRLKQEENSKENPNGGWDPINQVWTAHDSYEGGAKTLAYGIKLFQDKNNPIRTKWLELYDEQGYLTDDQANDALDDFSLQYMTEAKKIYDNKYGTGSWNKLSDKSQSILTDFQYNPNLRQFNKLMEGFYRGDIQQVGSEYSRKAGGKPLKRNEGIKADIDSIKSGYYSLHR